MYIFLDGCDHCNTFDSFGFVISYCFGGLARKSTAYKEQAKDAATCHPNIVFPAWLGESNLYFTIIFQDLMANTSMSTFWCHTFNVVLSMKGGNALRCAPGNFDDVMI